MGLRGKHTTIFYDGYDISTESSNIAFGVAYDEVEESGYNQDHSTLKGQGNSDVTLDGYFNGIAQDLHTALNAIADSDVIVSLALGENAIAAAGDLSFSAVQEQLNYDISPNKADVIAANIATKTRGGIVGEFGVMLDSQSGVSATANGTSIDQAASSSNGAVGYAHVTEISAGDTLTLKIQDSADDAAWADLITFTLDGSALTAERATVSGAVDRYIRATWTVSGSAISFSFTIFFVRK